MAGTQGILIRAHRLTLVRGHRILIVSGDREQDPCLSQSSLRQEVWVEICPARQKTPWREFWLCRIS